MGNMKITVLVEDTCLDQNKELLPEHGLSVHIMWRERQILFDTGASDAFVFNADKLGVKIQQVDFMVLSHHHYDHGGGLAHFLKKNLKSQVFLRNSKFAECYSKPSVFVNRYAGLDKSFIRDYQSRFEFIDKFSEISPNIFILTDISSYYQLPKGNRRLFVREGDAFKFDDFRHELIMVFKDTDGLVVFTGCSHRGILNMIKTVNDRFNGSVIKALFGGFHLVEKRRILKTLMDGRKEIEAIGEEIIKFPIQKIYTGHCTSDKAFHILKRYLGEKLVSFSTGSEIEVF